MAICITGMHRSGTSLLANILHECGVYLGAPEDLLLGAPSNREGHWEHIGLLAINEEILSVLGGSAGDPPPLPPGWETSSELEPLAERARPLVASLSKHTRWGWKDPRCSLTLPFWHRVVEDLRVVICSRHPAEVALSMQARDGLPLERGLELWFVYNRALLESARQGRFLVVEHDALFRNPAQEIGRLVDVLDLEATSLQRARAHEILNPDLRHHADFEGVALSAETTELFARLHDLGRAHREGIPAPPKPAAQLQAAREVLRERRRRVYSLQDELLSRRRESLDLRQRLVAESDARSRLLLDLDVLRPQVDELDRRSARAEAEKAALERMAASAETEKARLETERHRLTKEIEDLRQQIDTLHHSWSFRLTAPMRSISRLLRLAHPTSSSRR